MKKTLIILLSMALPAGLLLFPLDTHAFFGPWANRHQPVTAENGQVRIPLHTINDGRAHYFTFKADGRKISFFVLKSRDGVIRAAFDACDVCFPEKKGYSQTGDFMTCNNCGQRFHASKINVLKGGCNPAPLRRTTEGGDLVIAVTDIFTGLRYF
ncbi:MAG: DUF2318 domain-containing protein [Desulfobulbaceae bacterium]|nr:DUF2318 domain-containing protein [Desulfobulbaceae bacterium]MDY0351911.1 DUF2318 domain-containing protein [Desulfobulbaceae bacterium]